jgi:hypothetical protein
LPSLRKFGKYEVNDDRKSQLNILNNKLDKLKDKLKIKKKQLEEKNNEINILKHNMKKPSKQYKKISKKGGIYIMRVVDKTLDFDKNELLFVKFGGTDDPINRIHTYDTTTENRIQILKFCEVDD